MKRVHRLNLRIKSKVLPQICECNFFPYCEMKKVHLQDLMGKNFLSFMVEKSIREKKKTFPSQLSKILRVQRESKIKNAGDSFGKSILLL